MTPFTEEGRGPAWDPDPQEEASNQLHLEASNPVQGDLELYRQSMIDMVRDAGLDDSERGDPEWARRVADWVYDLGPGARFTADDIRERFGSSKAVGSVIRSAAQRRVIAKDGYVESRAISRHGGTIARWVRT